jgi:hypothetical protein
MALEEGMRFLLRRARLLDLKMSLDRLATKDEATAREIVSIMDGLPLALDQAGSYIEATHCSLSDYLRLYQSSQLYLLDERGANNDHPLSVIRTFTLAFDLLEQHNTQAAELLTVCAFLSSEAIPEAFFREGAAYLGSAFEELAADSLMFNSANQLRQRTVEALTLYQQALALYRLMLGPHHPKTRATRSAYIQLLQDLGRGDEATAVED